MTISCYGKYFKMNQEQIPIYNEVVDSVNHKKGQMFLIDAPGGCGKTFVLTTLLAKIRGQGKIALAMASTGIASTLLPKGSHYEQD